METLHTEPESNNESDDTEEESEEEEKKEIIKQPNPQMRSMENKRASMIKFKNPLDVFI